MRNFITQQPVLFAIVITLFDLGIGLLAFILGSLVGVPERVLVMVALLFSTAIPLVFIWWLHWWEDAGFVTRIQNARVLWFPLVIMVIPILVFGTVEGEVGFIQFFLVALFLTGLSEEAMSRGLLLRALLPLGKWYAVLVPAVLFGLTHITQLFLGMPLAENLLLITFNIPFGILYAALRLRTGSIWPLIIIHMFVDMFWVIGGAAGPGASFEMPIELKIIVAVLEVAYAIYILRKPNVVSITSGEAV